MSNGTGEGDDWESLLDTGKLDKNLENLNLVPAERSMGVDPFGDPIPAPGSRDLSDPFFSGPVRILTNGSRNNYRKPEPTLKILKRPEPQIKVAETQAPRSTLKTLEQREAEYAEARQRILGTESQTSSAATKSNQNPAKPSHTRQAGKKSANGGGGGDVRPPRGPDGSKGFQMRR